MENNTEGKGTRIKEGRKEGTNKGRQKEKAKEK